MVSLRNRSIGVSNFNLEQLRLLLKTAKVVPAVNQVRPSRWLSRCLLRHLLTRCALFTCRYASTRITTRKMLSSSNLRYSTTLLSRHMVLWRTSGLHSFPRLVRSPRFSVVAQADHSIPKRTRLQSAGRTCCPSACHSWASHSTLGACKRCCDRDDHE